jgi:hypothetical protein
VGRRKPSSNAAATKKSSHQSKHSERQFRMVVQAAITIFLLVLCSYLLLSNANSDAQKFASGLVGAVVAFWFKR